MRQEQSQTLDACKPDDDSQKDTESDYMAQVQEHVETQSNLVENALTHDAIGLTNSEDDDHDPMGPSVLENMEISMVHILPAEFQLTTH
ncbi:hypothetical protein ACFX2I_014917 [Malus domestica]